MKRILWLALFAAVSQGLAALPLAPGLYAVKGENGPDEYLSVVKRTHEFEIIWIRTQNEVADADGSTYAPRQYRATVPVTESRETFPVVFSFQKKLLKIPATQKLEAQLQPGNAGLTVTLAGKPIAFRSTGLREQTYVYMPMASPDMPFLFGSEGGSREFLLLERGDSPFFYFSEKQSTPEVFEATDFHFGLFDFAKDLPTNTVHILFTLRSQKKQQWNFEIDMVRTPASDVSGFLTGANRKKVRLTQSNDSNLVTHKSCRGEVCETLWSDYSSTYFLRQEKSIQVMRLHEDGKRLMASGKVMFTLTRDADETIHLKDSKGTERVFTPVKAESPNTSP